MTAPLTDARLDEIARYCSGNTFHEQAIRDLLTALAQCREEREAAREANIEKLKGVVDETRRQEVELLLRSAEGHREIIAALQYERDAATAALAAAREAGQSMYDILANEQCFCGPTVKCRRCKALDKWDVAHAPGQREEGT